MAKKTPSKFDFKLIQKIIKLLLKKDPKNWGLEVKICKELVDLYPSKDFWLFYQPPREIDSLLFFRGEWGQKDLKKQYSLFNVSNSDSSSENKTELSNEKFGEDMVIQKKQKTRAEILLAD